MSTSGTATLERPADGQPPVPVEGELPATPIEGEQPTPASAEGAHDYGSMEEFAARLNEALGDNGERQPTRVSEERAREIGHGPLVLVNLDQTYDAETKAKDAADARLTQELNGEAGFIKKHIRNIWKGNWFKGHYQRKYEAEAHKVIRETGNLHAFDGVSDDEAQESTAATITRFITPYEEMIHEGESRKVQGQDTPYAVGVKALLTRYANNELDDESLKQAEKEFDAEYRLDHPEEDLGSGRVRANNMIDIAHAVKGRMEHGESLEFVLANMRFMTGETRTTVRTEAAYDKLDQTVHNYLDSKFGRIVGEKTVSIAASVAIAGFKMGRGSAITTIGLVGAGAGLSGYLRERKRMTDDRVEHTRQMAMGGEYEAGAKRRDELESTRLETVQSVDLRNELDAVFNPERLAAGGPDAFKAAIKKLAEIEARVQYSDHNKVDLISYSSASAIARERLELDLTRARKKVFLRQHLANGGGQALGQPGATLESILNPEIESFTEERNEERSDKDELFKKIRRRRALKMGLAAAGTSLILAGAGSYVASTLLEGSSMGTGSIAPSSQFNTSHFGPNGSMEMSSDHQIISHTGPNGGTIDIADANGNVDPALAGLKVDANGNLDRSAWDALNSKGFNVQDLSHNGPVNPPVTGSTQDFVAAHQGDMRTLNISWEDNNTSAFDLNEQGGRLSYNPDGTVNVGESMTAGGSFNSEGSIDMTNGSENTFDFAFKQPDGSFIHKTFPYGAPLPKEYSDMLYQKSDGTWGFKGDGHVSWGKLDGDTFYSAASVPGDNQPITWPGAEPTHFVDTKITGPTVEAASGAHLVAAPSITERKSLEDLRTSQERRREDPYYHREYGSRYLEDHETEVMRSEVMPQLLDDPGASIAPNEALDFYADLLQRKRSPEYVESINQAINNSKELREMAENTHAIVGIPVNAAGASEANGIYNLLGKAYAQQDPESRDQSMILLHVNWYDDAMNDNEKRQLIEKTKSEIERARADFPDLRIASFETEWKRAEMGDTPIIGHVAKKLEDVTFLAMKRAMDEGRLPKDRDVLLIRNDADAIGVHRNYLKNYLGDAEANPDIDVFTGTTSFDNTKADRLPEMVFAGNFLQNLDLLVSAREKYAHTGGANFAVFSAIKAATGGQGFDIDGYSGAGSDDVNIARRIKLVREGALGRNRQGGLRGYVSRKRYNRRQGRTAKRQIAKRVVGARIDTDSDRTEGLFLQGVAVVDTWNSGFDTAGYRNRTDDNIDELRREYEAKISADPSARINQVISDMNTTMRVYKEFPGAVHTALELAFSGIKDPAERHAAYTISTDADGVKSVTLSDAGKQYIANYLTNYGETKMRQMYGLDPSGAQVKAKPMMLAV